jgi:hypothetical protein
LTVSIPWFVVPIKINDKPSSATDNYMSDQEKKNDSEPEEAKTEASGDSAANDDGVASEPVISTSISTDDLMESEVPTNEPGAAAAPIGSDRVLEITEEEPPFTPLNWTLIGMGMIATAVGFLLLRQADARATNWQAIWSPMIILSGYILVFLGIIIVRQPATTDE